MPTLAEQDASGTIRVYQLDEDSKWIDCGPDQAAASAALNIHLLSGTLRPMLWVGEKNTGGLLYLGGEKWQEPIKLDLSHPMSPVNGSLVCRRRRDAAICRR